MLESRQLLSTAAVSSTVAQPFVQAAPLAGVGSSAYSPQQIASAYGIDGVSFAGVSGNGAGQTIAIVEAYNDPNIQADLSAFDARFGLAAPPSFTVDNLGATATDAGWAVETALDVEWAHAIAPQANIVLVEAPNSSLGSLLSAVQTAARQPYVSVVSMSWGTSEFYGEWSAEGVFSTPSGHPNVTFIAASGDSGAWSGPSFPAVSPNVLAVGGTTLTLGSGSSAASQAGWSGSTGGFSGLDNGFQYGLSVPSYQASTLNSVGLNYGLRTTPDVSLNADPNTGYAVYDSVPYGGASGWFDVGGTSAAAPAWAGLVAITDQGLAASGKGTLTTTQLLGDLYSLPSSDFQDITTGFNGYYAGTGYDLITGLGSPRANLLIPGILAANGVQTGSITKAPPAANPQATGASAVHNAVVGSASSTASAVATSTTMTATASFSAGLSALPSPSQTATSTTASPGLSQASTGLGISAAPSAAPIGLGQGTSWTTAPVAYTPADSGDEPRSAIDVVDSSKGADPSTPESSTPEPPMPQAPNSDSPPPRPSSPEEILPAPGSGSSPRTVPMIPSWDPVESALRGVDAAIARLVTEAPTVRIDRVGESDRGRATGNAAKDGGAAPGLVAAGAIVALGQRVVIGRRRRRTSSWTIRPTGR